jgi:uncharacterized membrane-anchored protein
MIVDRRLPENRKTPLFISLILLQIVILAVMVFNSYAVIFRGDEILLEVMPVDPRSLFQGDYVILSYPFSNLDLTKVEYDFDPAIINYQEKVYLALEPEGDTWSPVMITKDKSKVRGKTYLEAKVLYTMPKAPEPSLGETGQSEKPEPGKSSLTVLRLKLSIEQYFVPEGKGKEIEDSIRQGDIYARVAVYKGKARVIDLTSK